MTKSNYSKVYSKAKFQQKEITEVTTILGYSEDVFMHYIHS